MSPVIHFDSEENHGICKMPKNIEHEKKKHPFFSLVIDVCG